MLLSLQMKMLGHGTVPGTFLHTQACLPLSPKKKVNHQPKSQCSFKHHSLVCYLLFLTRFVYLVYVVRCKSVECARVKKSVSAKKYKRNAMVRENKRYQGWKELAIVRAWVKKSG